MPASYTNASAFGIWTATKSSLTSIMIIQDISVSSSDNVTYSYSVNGEVDAVNQVKQPKKMRCNGILTQFFVSPTSVYANNAPLCGDTLLIDGTNWFVTSVEVSESNSSFRQIAIEGIETVW